MSWQQALRLVFYCAFAVGGFITLCAWLFSDDDGPHEPPPGDMPNVPPGAGGTR